MVDRRFKKVVLDLKNGGGKCNFCERNMKLVRWYETKNLMFIICFRCRKELKNVLSD